VASQIAAFDGALGAAELLSAKRQVDDDVDRRVAPGGLRSRLARVVPGAERIKITGRECPRIDQAFLDEMRGKLGPLLFSQEFEGEFIDSDASAFSSELIALALVDQFSDWPPL
jgi:hypothetical protein